MWAIFTSKLGMAGIALALVLGIVGTLYIQRNIARADLRTAQASLSQCRASLSTANASIAARAAQSATALASAAKVQAVVAPRSAHYVQQAGKLASHVVQGDDRCQRYEDAETAVRESLK